MARDRFYWPYTKRDIEHYINHVCQCLKKRRLVLLVREPLQSIVTSCPFEMVSTDFVKDHVEKLVHASNCTRNEATSYPPFYLLFGRPLRLPIDLNFDFKRNEDTTGYPRYTLKWKNAMKKTYTNTSLMASQNASRGENYYDKRCRSTVLQPEDRVLVRNLTLRGGPGKLRSFREDELCLWWLRK